MAMNLSELPTRLPTSVGTDAGTASLAPGRSVAAQLQATSGNQLLQLDAWHGASAAERTFHLHTSAAAPGTAQLEQLVNHILAPLN